MVTLPPYPHHSTRIRSYTHLPGNGNVSLIHGPLLPGLRTRLAGAAAAREEVRAAPSILVRTWTGLDVNPAPSHACSWPHLKRSHPSTCTHGTQLHTVLPRGNMMEKHTIAGGYPHNSIQESHRVRRAGCKPIGSTAPVPWPALPGRLSTPLPHYHLRFPGGLWSADGCGPSQAVGLGRGRK